MKTIDLNTAPVVLLDDSRPAHMAGNSYLFHSPECIICARCPSELPSALEAIDNAHEAGFYTAGWISYEVGYYFEKRLQKLSPRYAEEPLIWMMVTRERETLSPSDVEIFLHSSQRGNTRRSGTSFKKPDLSEKAYNTAINRIHHFIEAGDVYQINYTFPLPVEIDGSCLELYKELRKSQPVPYGAYINTGETEVLSFSPELFLERSGEKLKSKPMKGTAARGKTTTEDRATEKFLAGDEKSKAENLMIVDLIRNDLSRIAKPGSVKVPALFETEKYRTLFQMTSTVTGTALEDVTPTKALAAMFPCGSVTGAPKVRAMEIISELEPGARGVYCGAIGYFHKNTWSLNVPIRTLVHGAGQVGRLNVGSGIVADSNSRGEYEECLLKARFARHKAEQFALIETLLIESGRCNLLSVHLTRMRDSAEYFNFVFPETALRADIKAHAALFDSPRKLRLLLDATGAYTLSSDPIDSSPAQTGRITIAAPRTSSNDIFLRHKTTNRTVYEGAFKQAAANGYLDCIFMNEKGYVTEGAISNIFVELDNCLYTPPLSDGLLPGVKRAELLQTGFATERSISLQDLKSAQTLYLASAVRGLRRVTLE